ncbi:MAG: conjugal transfer protein TraO [Burkholderiaceae bacterium]|nr:conjugal transfer protein TraO [Burkholderiaceae bacterium]
MSNVVQKEISRHSLLTIFGLTALGVLILYVSYSWTTKETANATRLSPMGQTAGTSIEESHTYKKTLDDFNKKEADAAAKTGSTYISVMSSKTTPVVAVEDKDKDESSASPPTAPSTLTYSAQTQSSATLINEQHAELLREQIKTLLSAWTPVAHSTVKSSEDGVQVMNAMLTPSIAATAKMVANSQPQGQVIIEPYALVPAILVTGIDTDENSVVSAYVPSGPYAGAEVFAMGYKRLNTTVDMTFTSMQWKGHAYKITAKPVDLDTGRTALSGEVNNRYFERIILPAIAGGIGNTGQLFARANSETVITPQGGAVQSFQTPSSAAIAGSFASGMGIQAGQVLANDAANIAQKQVVVPAKTTIGIRFIGPVLSSDDVAANTVTSGSVNAVNPLTQGIQATGTPASTANLQRTQTVQQPPTVDMLPSPAITGYGNYRTQVPHSFIEVE